METTPIYIVDLSTILMAVISVATAALGWFSRTLWDAVQSLKNDLTKLQVDIGTNYIRYDRLQDALRPIMIALDEIKESLRHKVDKD